MHNAIRKLIFVIMLLSMILPSSAIASPRAPTKNQPTDDIATITVLHTNDVHGTLEPNTVSNYPGMARLATTVNTVRAAVGISNTLLLDAGDEMQGSLLSNIQKGKPTIDIFNLIGYGAATFGNHEFDWGQTILMSRTLEAAYPYVSANIVVSDTGSCDTAGWTSPAFAVPWTTVTVGAPGNQAVIGIIGVTTQETPFITIQSATAGLCFKDPAASIIHYWDDIKAAGANAIIVLSHLGLEDGGYGYGFPVYGDKTLANKLYTAGKPVNLIIGGHSHTNMAAAFVQNGITIAQAHSSSRKVGRADLVINKTTGAVTVTWTRLTINMTDTKDPTVDARITWWASDSAYQALINQVIGFTDVPLVRNYNGDSLMGEFINDSILYQLNSDGVTTNDADMVFNNAGGLRSDITAATYPLTLTYGAMFSVLPFGNATAIGNMTGAQIMELLNQSATLFTGAIQPAGIRFKFYRYSDALPGPQPFAWGAYEPEVRNRTTGVWESLVMTKTYQVATNEFLAPAGQDGYVPFKYMTNISYWGDMLNIVDAWVSTAYSTTASAYNGPNDDGLTDDRIWRNGTDALGSGTIIPITILHHNDSHGRLLKSGSTVGYSQLAAWINKERAHNPGYTILVASGDELQGDSMMYYYKSAAMGYAADGTTLPITMTINPFVKAMNAMNYAAFTLGNHEFNFGNAVFTTTLSQANFPVLQANLTDDGRYGIAEVPVRPYITVTLGAENISVAILGIGNHRVPNYELPSNILGLTFTNPIVEAQNQVPALRSAYDVVLALTHIGFTTNPNSVEVDNNVDTVLAAMVPGIDAIVGGHSHTPPYRATKWGSGNDALGTYLYLPALVGGPGNSQVLVNQANRYNTFLGEIILGVMPDGLGGYKVVTRAGRDIELASSDPEDTTIKDIVTPYQTLLNAYNNTVIGQTTVPIDTMQAFTRETNGANQQADASVYELTALHGIPVDFHLSGAMTNKKIADTATPANPFTLKISDMFSLMPYENSLVVLSMNGPQLKRVLERAYRNYYYYKYVTGQGGYSYYTTCLLDTNAGNQIVYRDTYPTLPDGNNVKALIIGGIPIDFSDASTYFNVSTVNYLAAGSCNFNDSGVSLWPLNQVVADTQYYVRDVVINYIEHLGTVSPAVEGRIAFATTVGTGGATYTYTDPQGQQTTIQVPAGAVAHTITLVFGPWSIPGYPANFAFAGHAFQLDAYQGTTYLPYFQFNLPVNVTIHYTDADVAGLNESLLKLLYWDGSTWIDAACGAYDYHPVDNWFAAPICHLSRFGVFAEAAMADFTATPTVGIAPLEVTFTNASTGDFTSSLWDFGDEITSTQTSPTHIYTQGGVYTVTLTVSGPGGTDTEIKTSYITVYSPVQSDFSATPTSGVAPLNVAFTNLSTGDFSSSLWNFGDGITSTQASPAHDYTLPGVYTVTLAVSGLGGADTEIKTSYITVYTPVQADFSGMPTSGIVPLNVSFTNLSTGDFTSSLWEFGDGITSTLTNPSHLYTTSGLYIVTLIVSGLGGTDSEIKTSYITVHTPVQVDFSGAPTSGIPPFNVVFTNLSTGDFSSSLWDFGDGATSTLTDPVHDYTTPGIYTVTLTVSGLGGTDTESKDSYITVYTPIHADFNATPTSGVAPLNVAFTNLSTGDFTSCLWVFGDGITSTLTSPVHVYTKPGYYTVHLTVSGLGGTNTMTITDYIQVFWQMFMPIITFGFLEP